MTQTLTQIHFFPLHVVKNLANQPRWRPKHLSHRNSTTNRILAESDVLLESAWCTRHAQFSFWGQLSTQLPRWEKFCHGHVTTRESSSQTLLTLLFFNKIYFLFLRCAISSPDCHHLSVDCLYFSGELVFFSFFFVCCIARSIFNFWLHLWGFLADFLPILDFLYVFLLPVILKKHGWVKGSHVFFVHLFDTGWCNTCMHVTYFL